MIMLFHIFLLLWAFNLLRAFLKWSWSKLVVGDPMKGRLVSRSPALHAQLTGAAAMAEGSRRQAIRDAWRQAEHEAADQTDARRTARHEKELAESHERWVQSLRSTCT